MPMLTPPRLVRAAETLVRDSFGVAAGESVLISADTLTEHRLLDAMANAVAAADARPLIALAPPLPYQGKLSDPYVSDSLRAAVAACDVWFDLCFPYHAGSGAHAAAMAAGRCRYALLSMSSAESFERLYGCVDFPALTAFNVALAEFFGAAAEQTARFTCPLGSDVTLVLDPPKLARSARCTTPGTHTVPGAQSFYPAAGSVRGRIVIQALFDEYFRPLASPITIEADGDITGFTGGGAADRASFGRALRRANGLEAGGQEAGSQEAGHQTGGLGRFIHFTYGFHPAAMRTGRQFIEDIRLPGSNAIGMGLPWWEPGGGENHPDGIVFEQSLWIDGAAVVREGEFVGPEPLRRLYHAMARRLD